MAAPRPVWVDPLSDRRWQEFAARHSAASIFHSQGWLQALRRTHGYEPAALALLLPDGTPSAGMVLCRVASRITGSRIVSLPFSDHCEPLADDESLSVLLDCLEEECERRGLQYVEWRTGRSSSNERRDGVAASYVHHQLDLTVGLKRLWNSFHPSHVLRKIRRSERDGIVYVEGTSTALARGFYDLLLKTRRRHGALPQPFRWYTNILRSLPESAKVRVALLDGKPIASIVTLLSNKAMVYKYGASDERYHRVGCVQLLLWRAITDAHEQGCTTFDFGRTDLENRGLIEFKNHWGTTSAPLTYYRLPPEATPRRGLWSGRRIPTRLLRLMPDCVLERVGGLVYRHMG